jgi:Family of unknown function (DUF6077)
MDNASVRLLKLKQYNPTSYRLDWYGAKLETFIFFCFSWYAAWSIQTLIIVQFRLPFYTLKYAILLAILVSLALVRVIRVETPANPPAVRQFELETYIPNSIAWVVAACIIIAGAVLFIKTGSATLFIAIILFSSLCAFLPAKRLRRQITQLPARPEVTLIVGLVIVIAFYLLARRFDLDEAANLNEAVGARRFGAPLLAFDTMLGHGTSPILLPTYRIESFPLLVAGLADLFDSPTIFVAHIVVPILFVALFAVAMARIGQESIHNDWIGALLLLLALRLFAGTTLANWGIYSLTRFFEGKAEFVAIVVPLLAYYGYRAVHDGRLVDFLLTAVLQISAVGLTANALYAAPLTVGLASLSAFVAQDWDKTTLGRFVGINTTSAYSVAIGLALIVTGNAFPSEFDSIGQAGDLFRFTVGPNLEGLSLILGISLGWLVARGLPSGRFWLVYTVLSAVLLVNPVLWPLYGYVTGNIGIRVFWSVPVLPLIAAALTLLLMQLFPARPWLRLALCLCTVPAAALWNERLSDPQNLIRVSWGWPSLKVDPENYERAKQIVAFTSPDCGVVAPEKVAAWITTIDDYPFPIAVRSLYLKHYRFTMPASEISYRERLFDVVTGEAPVMLQSGDASVARDHFHIGTVASFKANPNFEQAADLAKELGLTLRPRTDDFEIWTGPCRPIDPSPHAND